MNIKQEEIKKVTIKENTILTFLEKLEKKEKAIEYIRAIKDANKNPKINCKIKTIPSDGDLGIKKYV